MHLLGQSGAIFGVRDDHQAVSKACKVAMASRGGELALSAAMRFLPSSTSLRHEARKDSAVPAR